MLSHLKWVFRPIGPPEVEGSAVDTAQRGSRQAMGCYSVVSNQVHRCRTILLSSSSDRTRPINTKPRWHDQNL
jgi:hypothetical protein